MTIGAIAFIGALVAFAAQMLWNKLTGKEASSWEDYKQSSDYNSFDA